MKKRKPPAAKSDTKPRRKKAQLPPPIDVLATIKAEIAEGADLLRGHYPDADEEELRDRATSLLRERYKTGHWPADEEIKAKAVRDIAKASADVIDWGAEYARRNGR